MAKTFVTFDLWQPAAEDFSFMQANADATTRLRWTDTHTWGILRSNAYPAVVNIPVSGASLVPETMPNILAAPVSLNATTGYVSVGAGSSSTANPQVAGMVAYDIAGNRIAINDDATFDANTVSPYGLKSTGNVGIPLNVPGGGGYPTPAAGTYYLWAEYQQVNQSVPVIGEDASIHYPQVDDGYVIRITTGAAGPIPPTGDGISIFLAKINWTGGTTSGSPVITATNVNVADTSGNYVRPASLSPGDPKRVWAGVRPQDVEIVVDVTNKMSSQYPTAGTGYQDGYVGSLHDHVNGIGSGVPTNANVHGLTLKDIPGAGAEPVATLNQQDSLAKGLIDLNIPQNSPPSPGEGGAIGQFVTAGQCHIETVGLTPNVVLDTLASSNGITQTIKTRWVRVQDFDETTAQRAAFLMGNRLIRLFPNMRDTQSPGSTDPSVTTDPNSGDGWVGFNSSEDNTGVYLIYGTLGVLASGQNVLVVNKTPLTGWPASMDPSIDMTDNLALGRVYWNKTANELYRNMTEPNTADTVNNQPDDLRALGLVGPQQLSNILKADPNLGGLSQQVFENQVSNSAYYFGDTNLVETFSGIGGGYIINPGTSVTAGTEPLLLTQGPAAMTARNWSMNAGQLNTAHIFQLIKNCKPGKFYGLSFWAKADAAFNARLGLGITTNAVNTPNVVTTQNQTVGVFQDITVQNDGAYHRYSMVLQVLSGAGAPSADPALLKYLCFQFSAGNVTPGAGSITITNVQLTEGEWIPGYMGCQYVPSGGIIMWDFNTSCPPGFQDVAAAAGKFIVGANGFVAPGASGGPNFNPAASVGVTGNENQNHTHNLPDTDNTFSLGGGTTGALGNGTPPNYKHTSTEESSHDHNIPGSQIPYYGLKLCRAI